MTKTGSQMYYNLSSMDTSQIPKMIWRDGISLKLTDIQWIGDNRLASADTAVGNNFAAKGFYTGTYQVNMPTGYVPHLTKALEMDLITREGLEIAAKHILTMILRID